MRTYPEGPGFVKGSETSEEAAERADTPSREAKVDEAYRLLAEAEYANPPGLTSDELERITGWPHQTASAILRKLVLDGYAYDSPVRRLTRYGRKAVVRRIRPQ